jgi:hypothetical protein
MDVKETIKIRDDKKEGERRTDLVVFGGNPLGAVEVENVSILGIVVAKDGS